MGLGSEGVFTIYREMKKILVLIASPSDSSCLGRRCWLESAGIKRWVLWRGGRSGSFTVGCLEKEMTIPVPVLVWD